MNVQKIAAEQYIKLLEQLPSVLNAELKTGPDGELSEIHILSKTDRTAKQIVRDVQSALLAKFKLTIDHKIISVAQIPVEQNDFKRNIRIKFLGLDITFHSEGCVIEVRLESEGRVYAKSASGNKTKANRYRAIAIATADVINDIIGEQALISLEDVRVTELANQPVVLVSLTLRSEGKIRMLVGSCADDDSGGLAVVKATLDAVNRSISAFS